MRLEERPAWGRWVAPKPLESKPIHRWYVFPHSFTSELVQGLIDEWGLGSNDRVLDPFAGAGTTVLAAKETGIPASGYDLSPLAVHVARAKIANYSVPRLEGAWTKLKRTLRPQGWDAPRRGYPRLVQQALPGRLLGAFDAVDREIAALSCSRTERDFFRLALLKTLPRFSRAVASGGWVRWVERRSSAAGLPRALSARVEAMLDDLRNVKRPRRSEWRVEQGDARRLPERASTYSAVITSPPYPNRHDYTRVFGVELMFGFLDWEGTRALRYQSFESHPEARPARGEAKDYVPPKRLSRATARLKREGIRRVPRMLEGYFLDMYLCLREVRRVCRTGARVALVVGNAQYSGEPVPVDELTVEVGAQAGLLCQKVLVARYRGNSAQQMARFGRNPSRESVVVFRV